MDVDTAVVSDRKGSIAVLSCSNQSEGILIYSLMHLFVGVISDRFALFFLTSFTTTSVLFGSEISKLEPDQTSVLVRFGLFGLVRCTWIIWFLAYNKAQRN